MPSRPDTLCWLLRRALCGGERNQDNSENTQ
jgi:hypothetical protein